MCWDSGKGKYSSVVVLGLASEVNEQDCGLFVKVSRGDQEGRGPGPGQSSNSAGQIF